MKPTDVSQVLKDTDYVRVSGSEEESRAAGYLKNRCEALGARAWIEPFPVDVAEIHSASLTADGRTIPCRGYKLCGSGTVRAPLVYLPNTDPASLIRARDSIVLLDTGISYWVYHDLLDNGVKGIITYDGDVHYPDDDIDQKMLRPYVSCGEKVLCANINAKEAFRLMAAGAREAEISIQQTESRADSRNVVAEIPGQTDEWIILSAHYDSTPLSHGAYDNMTGCIGLLGIMEALIGTAPHRYGLRFLFCGSEEVGLLGSKAYTAGHEEDLKKIVLNINLDMLGTFMGKFIACVSAEERLRHFIEYFCAIRGWGIESRQDVYSSDSTPFADHGVPALSFARIAPRSQATIHNRYDTAEVLSPEQMCRDIDFLSDFTRTLADAFRCPVGREIPEKVKTRLDEYLLRKRKES